ncbi:MAG: amino acid decarboxylase [Saprospiraceae bacterium]|nr:amino acid decarboxylase [Saprospiraceae bacterium]
MDNGLTHSENSELISRDSLEPSADQFDELMQASMKYATRFLEEITEAKAYRGVHNSAEVIAGLPIMEHGRDYQTILDVLKIALEGAGINAASPHHMGYVPGGGIVTSALGDFLAALGNEYAGLSFASPGGVAIENAVLHWLKVLLDFPKEGVGNLTSGGSIATLIAVVAARHHHSVTPENIRKKVVYSTSQLHHCVHKSLRIAGLDFCTFRSIPMEEDFTLSLTQLRSQIEQDHASGLEPFMVLASAGSTDVGAIDPLLEIATIAKEYRCWFHVDAAFGGFFKLVPELSDHFNGIGLADSVVIDPHKGLFLAYGSGAVLVRHKEAALQAFEYRAHYMQDAITSFDHPDPADLSPELTKHFRGLRMWLSLQYFGVAPFRQVLTEKLELTRYFYRKVQSMGFVVGPDPMLTAVIFRWSHRNSPEEDNNINRQILHAIQKDGRVYLSSTSIEGVFWLRICILVFRTHQLHVDLLLDILEKSLETKKDHQATPDDLSPN